MTHHPPPIRDRVSDQPRRGNTMTGWQAVIALGIAAITVLGCGWGGVFYLLNR